VNLTFRPLTREDFPMLSSWLAAPHVHQWWKEDPAPAAVEAKFGPEVDGIEPTELFVVEVHGTAVGMIQRYRIADYPEWVVSLAPTGVPAADAAGMDYLIGDVALIGQGLGPAMLAEFAALTLDRYPECTALVVDIDPSNRRSWRAIEKAGFTRVWAGDLEAEDPDDAGPAYVYVLARST
jgi:aminoglycoside 6'-N-acetyltransferase